MATKKLIEVALPLEKINEEAEREKQIRHGHPSNIHQYWARRPFTTARAIIWASLVDDPSAHPELFPTEKEQHKERQRLFKILEDLVVWENSSNQDILNAAKLEINKSTNNNPPDLLDPFAGGGAIPMEAQRLGLRTYAHDLNPIAVMINKAMIELTSKFSGKGPINPKESRIRGIQEIGMKGMATDVLYYGLRIKDEAQKRIGHLYPQVNLPKVNGGGNATAISWIWTRVITCPNPLCGCEMPLAKTFDLSTKKGALHSVELSYDGKKARYSVKDCKAKLNGTISRSGGICPKCGTPVDFAYIRSQATNGDMRSSMMAVVCEAKKGRLYLSPDEEQLSCANVDRPDEYPDAEMAYNPRNFNTPNYGMDHFADLFTNRQMTALKTFADLIKVIQKEVENDAIKAGMDNDHLPLSKGGTGAKAYSEAVAIHLTFILDKMTCLHSNLTMWKPLAQCPLSFFGRQAIPMAWDYAEANPFSNSSGSFQVLLDGYVKALKTAFIHPITAEGKANQFDAQKDCGLRDIMISTDPPYYDNISYADLSDYFYMWMRYSLKDIYPELFTTIQVPKKEELVATSYRFDGDSIKAKEFFEEGMQKACIQMQKYSREDIPVTIYYAYKQRDTDDKNNIGSSGWETMISAIINSGFSITGTWPVRTERAARNVGLGANALASSIVLVCRKRPEDAAQITRRSLINILRRELRPALQKMQESNIAPVDLAQSAIGPGMGVFSRYRKVLEADGSSMSVQSALHVINEEIDLYFNEQVGDLDAMSRFCVDLYSQNAFNDFRFGDADILARAKGTSVDALKAHGVVYSKAGNVHLIERTDLPEKMDNNESCIWLLTQQLTQAMATGGVEACAKAIFMMLGSNAERAKDLAYRLYTIAEQKKWSTEAFAYNALVVAWPDIQSRAAMMKRELPEQLDLFSMGLLNPNS